MKMKSQDSYGDVKENFQIEIFFSFISFTLVVCRLANLNFFFRFRRPL